MYTNKQQQISEKSNAWRIVLEEYGFTKACIRMDGFERGLMVRFNAVLDLEAFLKRMLDGTFLDVRQKDIIQEEWEFIKTVPFELKTNRDDIDMLFSNNVIRFEAPENISVERDEILYMIEDCLTEWYISFCKQMTEDFRNLFKCVDIHRAPGYYKQKELGSMEIVKA